MLSSFRMYDIQVKKVKSLMKAGAGYKRRRLGTG